MKVVYAHPGGRGWDTVTLLARLAARLLEAELVETRLDREPSRLAKSAALLPRRHGDQACLVIAAQPGHLQALLRPGTWTRGYSHVSAWVIDSFWTERIPLLARDRGHLDQVFVTDQELVDTWQRVTGTPTHWLPFGSDVLDRGGVGGAREVDLLRVGRQPAAWDDDEAVEAAARAVGVRFQGRTPYVDDPVANQDALLASMRGARFTLSFNNVASPAEYTHHQHQYVTGRWTDALANGATVAGISPRCAVTREVLWPEGLLELSSAELGPGLAEVRDAVAGWTPERARLNHLRALERLDWRLRLRELVEVAGLDRPATLDRELARLDAATSGARGGTDSRGVGDG